MSKKFPHIRLYGNKQRAAQHVKLSMSELFRTEELAKQMGVPIYARTVRLDDDTLIRTSVNAGVQTIYIYSEVPEPVEVEEQIEELGPEVYERCPPAFVLYKRKTKNFPPADEADGYIVAYNRTADTWTIATVSDFVGAEGNGFWGVKSNEANHKICDVVTWPGQQGGFADWGWCEGWGTQTSATHPGPDVWWQAYFFVAGMKVNAPAGAKVFGAGIFDQKYRIIAYENDAEDIYIFEADLAAPVDGEITPSWTLVAKHDYRDFTPAYEDGRVSDRWCVPTGSAFVSENAEAFFAMGQEVKNPYGEEHAKYGAGIGERSDYIMQLWKANLETGTLEVVRDNWGAMPSQYVAVGWNSHDDPAPDGDAQPFLDLQYNDPPWYDPCLTGIDPTEIPGSQGSLAAGHSDQYHAASYSNRNAEHGALVRTIGGLDKLYIYELRVHYTADSNYVIQRTPARVETGKHRVFTNCAIEGYYFDRTSLTHVMAIEVTRTDIADGELWIHCYESTDGINKKEVDKLQLCEITINGALSHSYEREWWPWPFTGHKTCDENDDLSKVNQVREATGSVSPKHSDVTGNVTLHLTRRTILDHHPKIPGSWRYMEIEETGDGLYGGGKRTYKIIDNNQILETFSLNIEEYNSWDAIYGWYDLWNGWPYPLASFNRPTGLARFYSPTSQTTQGPGVYENAFVGELSEVMSPIGGAEPDLKKVRSYILDPVDCNVPTTAMFSGVYVPGEKAQIQSILHSGPPNSTSQVGTVSSTYPNPLYPTPKDIGFVTDDSNPAASWGIKGFPDTFSINPIGLHGLWPISIYGDPDFASPPDASFAKAGCIDSAGIFFLHKYYHNAPEQQATLWGTFGARFQLATPQGMYPVNYVSVHRPINTKEGQTITPYIWLKCNDVRSEYRLTSDPNPQNVNYYKTGVQTASTYPPYPLNSPALPTDVWVDYKQHYPGWPTLYQPLDPSDTGEVPIGTSTIFWVKGPFAAQDSSKATMQTLADANWTIESNILTAEQIKELTEEASIDIFEIAVI